MYLDNNKKITVEICSEGYAHLRGLVRNILKYGDQGNHEIDRYYDMGLHVISSIIRDFEAIYPEVKKQYDEWEKNPK